MNSPLFPPDDQAPTGSSDDALLFSSLEQAVNTHFYTGCDRVTQAILSRCQWVISVNWDMPTLTIACPDTETYWSIVNSIETISSYLSRVTRASKIEVIPGDRKSIYFEVEISA